MENFNISSKQVDYCLLEESYSNWKSQVSHFNNTIEVSFFNENQIPISIGDYDWFIERTQDNKINMFKVHYDILNNKWSKEIIIQDIIAIIDTPKLLKSNTIILDKIVGMISTKSEFDKKKYQLQVAKHVPASLIYNQLKKSYCEVYNNRIDIYNVSALVLKLLPTFRQIELMDLKVSGEGGNFIFDTINSLQISLEELSENVRVIKYHIKEVKGEFECIYYNGTFTVIAEKELIDFIYSKIPVFIPFNDMINN